MNNKLILTLVAGVFAANANAESINLNPLVVSATRSEINSFDAPAAVDVVEQSSIQDAQLGMVLSESLKRVAGVSALSRNQYAQDPVISLRGFGARSTFGVTGIRLYVDGIPLTMPDGIGQPGNIDFEMVKSMEVLKGPFSTMYGNGAGGVISIKTIAPPKDPEISTSFLVGSYGTRKESVQFSGAMNGIGYIFNESNFNTDGYRDHSQAHKKQSTAEITFDLQNDTHVTILANYFKMQAQDPLGLAGQGSDSAKIAFDSTKSTGYLAANIPNVWLSSKNVPLSAIVTNTRVYRENTQIGINLDHEINENNSVKLIAYAGHRNNNQFLSTTTAPFPNPTPRGVIKPGGCNNGEYCGKDSTISRDFIGSDLSWTNSGLIIGKNYKLVSGIAYAYMTDERRDIGTSNGVITLTGLAKPNRQEVDNTINLDEYFQGQLALNDQLDLHAGIRNVFTTSIFNPTWHGDQSAKAALIKYSSGQFSNTTPSVGILWKVHPSTNFYADYGKGFQTPNSIQMAYKDSLGGGPNNTLAGSTSDNFELGLKSFINESTRLNAAVFRTVSANEIEIDIGGGYSVYKNIPVDTVRNGLEVSLNAELPNNFGIYGAYTYMDAKFAGNFNSTSLGLVNSGNKIPGIFKNQLYGELSWKYSDLGFTTALETIVNSRVYANDTNTAYASGYNITNLRASFKQSIGDWQLSEFARIENIFDRNYISALRINDSSGQFYEAGSGRNYMAGISVAYHF